MEEVSFKNTDENINNNNNINGLFLFFILLSLLAFISTFYIDSIKNFEIDFYKFIIPSYSRIKNISYNKIPIDNDYTQTLLDI